VPAAVGWVAYDGSARFLRTVRSVSFRHADRRLFIDGDSEWHARVESLVAAGAATAAEHVTEHPTVAADGPSRGARSSPSLSHAPDDPVGGSSGTEVRWRHDDAAYLDRIGRCLEAIRRGDSYQLCLTNLATVTHPVDPWTAYLRLRAGSPTHRAGFLRLGDRTLVSASPERFVSLSADGTVSSSPIKGTRPRAAEPERDAALAVELRADEKELAENLMIVDLVRNDLSRIAVTGSVSVDALFAVESYPQVHQLVSTVSAHLLHGCTIANVVGALFPAGSMTGAPKRRAMELLAEFEGGPRGLYAGAFGLVRGDGSAELAMTIRGAEFDSSGTAFVGAGGGITALSRPDAELAEMKLKAAPILRALADV
jgi:anthranilate synthase component 1